MSSLRLFPDRVEVLPLATAVLQGVSRDSASVIGEYRLDPDDEPVFTARISSQEDLLGHRYEPVPGVWSMLTRSDDDGYHLKIGVRQGYGRAWITAIRQHKRSCPCMLPPYQVKAYLLGYLSENGV